MSDVLSKKELRAMDAYWRAANYLSVGQIYLLDNPLLKEPLTLEHIKPRLLGHWGTTPGLNFVYVHLNRLIKKFDLDMIYLAGPGHGGPGLVANTYLEGTYSEVYPNMSQDAQGMQKLFTEDGEIEGIHVIVHPDMSNPTDVVAVRPPASVAWPVEAFEKTLKLISSHWEQVC